MGRSVIDFTGRRNGLKSQHDKDVVTLFANAVKQELSANYLLDDEVTMLEAYSIIDRKWEEFMGMEHPKSVAYFCRFTPCEDIR